MFRCRGLALLSICIISAASLAAEPTWESRDGSFKVTYESELQPLVINRIHSWTLNVTDAAGTPVEGAVITVDGGMPIHDHGLPTQPRVTNEVAPGRYVLEGVRFHMPGSWELVVTIESGDVRDAVVIVLDL
jgi:hypothetical protein